MPDPRTTFREALSRACDPLGFDFTSQREVACARVLALYDAARAENDALRETLTDVTDALALFHDADEERNDTTTRRIGRVIGKARRLLATPPHKGHPVSKTIRCPDCGELTDVPAYPGDGAYQTCGCPTGKRLAREAPREES